MGGDIEENHDAARNNPMTSLPLNVGPVMSATSWVCTVQCVSCNSGLGFQNKRLRAVREARQDVILD